MHDTALPPEPRELSRQKYALIRQATLPHIVFDRIAFIKERARGKSVLDIGCVEHSVENRKRQQDWVHGHLREVAAEILGMDYEKAEVEKMRGLGYNVVAGDATDFHLGRTFDVIVAGETLEHLLNAQGLIRCAREHLRPGGELILTVPNGNSLNYFLQNLIFGYEIDGYDHVAFYTPLTVFNLLAKCGMRMKALAFILPNTASHHRSKALSALVTCVRAVQLPFALVRGSMCRQMAIVAEVA